MVVVKKFFIVDELVLFNEFSLVSLIIYFLVSIVYVFLLLIWIGVFVNYEVLVSIFSVVDL